MESFKTQLEEITSLFNDRMADFQKELKGAIPATSPSSNLNSQFGTFRSFVLTALENLQLQVELLARQHDELEMRSRRKILLVHGVAEVEKENVSVSVSKLLSEQLGLPQLSSDAISRCHRLGRSGEDKSRAVLVKFKDLLVRDKVWASKTKLKGTGVTLSEFLIRSRHKTFLMARQRFGVTKCWTKDGSIMVLDCNGKRHRITSLFELNAIPTSTQSVSGSAAAPARSVEAPKDPRPVPSRVKRVTKK